MNSPEGVAKEVPINFNDLPYELQLKIFSFLTLEELSECVSLVCRKWRDAANDPVLWKDLYFKVNEPQTAKVVIKILNKRGSNLRSLTLRAASFPSKKLALCSTSLCLMTSLDLGFCDFVDSSLIESFVQNCPLIQNLNVEGCLLINQKAVNAIVTLEHLRHLNLSHCNMLTDEAVVTIASRCPKLNYLNIDGITRITDRSICFLGNHLNTVLRKIVLDGEELTDASILSLSKCSQMTALSISYAENITDISLGNIKRLKHITDFKLRRSTKLSNAALVDLFTGSSMENLVSLQFDSIMLEDSGVSALSKSCKHLRYLSLPWCWEITDIGLKMIITNCRKLEELDLLGLYNLTGACLLMIPEYLPNLCVLNLEQCNHIIDAILLKLVRIVPSLKVYDYYGEIVPLSDEEEDDDPNG